MRLPYRIAVVVLIILMLPVMAAVAICVLVLTGRPVLFVQRRAGKFGKPFLLYKFRTMAVGAERSQPSLRTRNESDGPAFKIRDDPRFTPVGRFLSHTGFDELPQLWNVLRGDMALIGPRPLPESEAEKLAPWMRKRHDILPGIISPAILTGKYHQNFTDWMKSDVAYAKEKSLRYDTLLLFRLIPFMTGLFVREVFRHR